jgi:formylglycine-generating enzyme required for sulfatase activity
LDWYEADISKIGGKVNVDTSSPEKTSSGAVPYQNKRVFRGGSWLKNASMLRSAARLAGKDMNNYWNAVNHMDCEKGFRLVCTAGLK